MAGPVDRRVSRTKGGRRNLTCLFECTGKSTDWRVFDTYRAVSVYPHTVNLCADDGVRYTLVTCPWDYAPRTALVGSVAGVSAGDRVIVCTVNALPDYDPAFGVDTVRGEWSPLVDEWTEYLLEGDLLCIAPIAFGNWQGLVGAGPGATPAGDDYLHGRVCAHMRLCGKDDFVRDVEENYPSRATVRLSGEFMADLLDFRIWRRGNELIRALGRQCPKRVVRAVGRISEWGHSSGRAWLAGFAAGYNEIS